MSELKITDEMKEAIKLEIRSSVKESFESEIEKREDLIIEAYASKKEKMKEEKSDDESDNDKNSDDDEDSDEDDESDSDEEEDDSVNESMSVVAMAKGGKNKSDTKSMNISRFSDLQRLAKSGKYEYFTVKKRNGEEVEYHVDYSGGKPELVKM